MASTTRQDESAPTAPAGPPGASRSRAYFVAGAFGAVAGGSLAGDAIAFGFSAFPAWLGRPVAAAMLLLGFAAGAGAGVLLLRRWYRKQAEAAAR